MNSLMFDSNNLDLNFIYLAMSMLWTKSQETDPDKFIKICDYWYSLA